MDSVALLLERLDVLLHEAEDIPGMAAQRAMNNLSKVLRQFFDGIDWENMPSEVRVVIERRYKIFRRRYLAKRNDWDRTSMRNLLQAVRYAQQNYTDQVRTHRRSSGKVAHASLYGMAGAGLGTGLAFLALTLGQALGVSAATAAFATPTAYLGVLSGGSAAAALAGVGYGSSLSASNDAWFDGALERVNAAATALEGALDADASP